MNQKDFKAVSSGEEHGESPPSHLRTVPTSVSAHTFCVSCKVWFSAARAEVDTISYATKYTTEIIRRIFLLQPNQVSCNCS